MIDDQLPRAGDRRASAARRRERLTAFAAAVPPPVLRVCFAPRVPWPRRHEGPPR